MGLSFSFYSVKKTSSARPIWHYPPVSIHFALHQPVFPFQKSESPERVGFSPGWTKTPWEGVRATEYYRIVMVKSTETEACHSIRPNCRIIPMLGRTIAELFDKAKMHGYIGLCSNQKGGCSRVGNTSARHRLGPMAAALSPASSMSGSSTTRDSSTLQVISFRRRTPSDPGATPYWTLSRGAWTRPPATLLI
jgi:hypothetical protein